MNITQKAYNLCLKHLPEHLMEFVDETDYGAVVNPKGWVFVSRAMKDRLGQDWKEASLTLLKGGTEREELPPVDLTPPETVNPRLGYLKMLAYYGTKKKNKTKKKKKKKKTKRAHS